MKILGSMSRLLFSFISILYIAGIFLLAPSPIVQELSFFNPYSLLHIPLYGILTLLLIFSLFPLKIGFSLKNPTNHEDHSRFSFAGLIALTVAIADEIHQTYIPTRNGSLLDILIDLIGILIVLIIFPRFARQVT